MSSLNSSITFTFPRYESRQEAEGTNEGQQLSNTITNKEDTSNNNQIYNNKTSFTDSMKNLQSPSTNFNGFQLMIVSCASACRFRPQQVQLESWPGSCLFSHVETVALQSKTSA